MATPKQLKNNQSGLVSFLVVMVVLAIITLVVLAYAQIARREQRQSLDRQLNSQAFYAAESGVNDAMEKLEANPSLATTDYTDCDSFITAASLDTDLGDDSSYSCLLVDSSPTELRYDGIDPGQSQIIPINPKGASVVNSVGFTWTQHGNGNSAIKTGCRELSDVDAGDNQLPPDWYENCELPMLRIEMVPFTGAEDRSRLIEERAVFFVMPTSNTFTDNPAPFKVISYASGAGLNRQGKLVGSHCSDNAYFSECAIWINRSGFRGYARITPLYLPARVRINALSTSSSAVELSNAQVEIDVTGKATDVVKRIRVFRSLNTNGAPVPGYALQSLGTQCKQFGFEGGGLTFTPSVDACNPIN